MRSVEERIISEVDGLSDEELFREWRRIAKRRDCPQPHRWLMALALQYDKIIADKEERGTKVPDKVRRRYRMAVQLDMKGLAKESDFLTPIYEDYETKGDDMKKTKKAVKEARVTASSVLIKLLGAEKVGSDEFLITQVKERTGSTLFDEKQLAWYKWKYRQGKLSGMDGKQHAIAQGSAKKAAKAAKKKKIIIKDRRSKEPALV